MEFLLGIASGVLVGVVVGLLTPALIEKGHHQTLLKFLTSSPFQMLLAANRWIWRSLWLCIRLFFCLTIVFAGVVAAGAFGQLLDGMHRASVGTTAIVLAVVMATNLFTIYVLRGVYRRYRAWRAMRSPESQPGA